MPSDVIVAPLAAAALQLAAAGELEIDFSVQRVILYDPETQRPIAYCCPWEQCEQVALRRLERPREAPAVIAAAQGVAQVVAAADGDRASPRTGRLTGAQRELVHQVWLAHVDEPHITPAAISLELERSYCLRVTPATVASYRPPQCRQPHDPLPEVIQAAAHKIRRGRAGPRSSP